MTQRPLLPPIANQPVFTSWSGGKDSCLALHRAVALGAKPAFLFTMFIESGTRSRSHGLARDVILAQAVSLNIPLISRAASWNDYETAFLDGLHELHAAGVSIGIFGDIDTQAHLDWVRRVCALASITPVEPLWQAPRRQLLDEFLAAGFRATIVALKPNLIPPDFIGRTLDHPLIDELADLGVDPSGENGEYHTVVTDGPLFSEPLHLHPGETVLRNGCLFHDFALA